MRQEEQVNASIYNNLILMTIEIQHLTEAIKHLTAEVQNLTQATKEK